MNWRNLLLTLVFLTSFQFSNAQHSVAREWNELLLTSIRNDFARPTVHARNLFHTSIAMYDAWAVFNEEAETVFLGKEFGGYTCPFDGIPMPNDIKAAQEEAISYASYRLLRHRFEDSPGAQLLTIYYNNLILSLGYDPGVTSTDYSTGSPAALGNYIAQCLINFGMQDGANEQNDYGNLHYEPVNEPLVTDLFGNPDITDFNRWQPLTLDVFIDQSGNVTPLSTPDFLSPEWGSVTPFSLTDDDLTIYERDGNEYKVYHDPGAPPYLDLNNVGGLSEEYKWGFALVSVWSSHLDPSDGVMWDISPGSIGNISDYPTDIAGFRDFYNLIDGGDPSQGHPINPKTGQPYEPQIVPRADYARVLAEFWADGPDSETPPGHWFTILNYVNDHPQFQKRYRGQGDELDELEWDVKAYLMMGGAMHDCAISAWGIKGWYDYLRPISAIRGMAELGQSTDPNLPSYHPGGIPLIPGYIELVEPGDVLAGNNGEHVGKIKLYAWRGPEFIADPDTDVAGVGWILAGNWWPYQRPSFVTPPFAGYVSGHSTYSRAAAEVMTLLTGDEFFPGGMAEFHAEKNEFLVFEDGPSEDIILQWATYVDASEQTSLSRIWGGIHPPADDIPGRLIGREIGIDVFHLAETYFYKDKDNDGFFSYEDCNDDDPNINPNATEICDGIDNNCDGQEDEDLPLFIYYLDNDSDGFGTSSDFIVDCYGTPPANYVFNNADCDDSNPNINPNSPEICDGIDNDCNILIDDGLTVYTYYFDNDNDNFGDAGNWLDTCLVNPPMGYVLNALDCDDNNASLNPDIAEICDGIDNDCNGDIDDGLTVYTYYLDSDNDNYGDAGSWLDTCLVNPPMGYVTNALDCNDADATLNPDIAEVCDGIDNDCNGDIDDGLTLYTYYFDSDNDNYGDINARLDTCLATPPVGYVTNDLDCVDTNPNLNPDIAEICDGIDNDCNGEIDDAIPYYTYYADNDSDSFGDANSSILVCADTPPFGYVTNDLDCDDFDAGINPDSQDIPDNGIDEDCSGVDLYERTKLFPNPTGGELTIHHVVEGEMFVRIYTSEGRYTDQITMNFENNSATIDVSNLPPGLYLFEFMYSNERRAFVRRVVCQ